MQQGTSKAIVDLERNRRTLKKPANHIPWFGCGAGRVYSIGVSIQIVSSYINYVLSLLRTIDPVFTTVYISERHQQVNATRANNGSKIMKKAPKWVP